MENPLRDGLLLQHLLGAQWMRPDVLEGEWRRAFKLELDLCPISLSDVFDFVINGHSRNRMDDLFDVSRCLALRLLMRDTCDFTAT